MSTRGTTTSPIPRFSRRHLLALGASGLGAVLVAGVTVGELVDHGVLPGQSLLDELDGACTLDVPRSRFGALGRQINGSFYSEHRHTTVGYSLGLPATLRADDPTPLVVFLHGFGSSHRAHLGAARTPALAAALLINGRPLPPMAVVTVDGGPHYWHAYGDDDPLAMVVDELLPRCRAVGVGRREGSVGVMGISMGGYGAFLFGEQRPDVFSAVAGLSPAVFTNFAQAHGSNAGAFRSAQDFARHDVVTHAGALAHTPTFVASGFHDPFYPGALDFHAALPASTPAQAIFAKGCHGGEFFKLHTPDALSFMNRHLYANLA